MSLKLGKKKAGDIKSLQDDPEQEGIVGFFKSQKQAKDYLLEIAREYALCEKLLGIEKASGACFAYRLGRCNGSCLEEEKPLLYNLRFTTAFSQLRIKPWPFPGPITIEEVHPYNGSKEYFVVDKWCYLGSWKVDNGLEINELQKEVVFDVDTYNILKRYLLKKENQKKIQLWKEAMKDRPLLQLTTQQ